MAKRKKKGKELAEPDRSFAINPFASLSKADLSLSTEPVVEAKPEPEPEPEQESGFPPEFTADPLVTRIEKKGRGGKTVTVFEGFRAQYELEMQELAGDLRQHLGTGGTLRGDTLELQGDHRQKAAAWLRGIGFKVKGI